MTETIVRVSTPSRLHFGMLSFGQSGVRQFGGVGLMIDEPGIRLRITLADRLECTGPLAARAEQFARRALTALDENAADSEQRHDSRVPLLARRAVPPLPNGGPSLLSKPAVALGCRIEIEAAPREHIGLGTGTQLGLAIAAGLNALRGSPAIPTAELARLAGRAERSSIGTHGFAAGGLLVEAGKFNHDVAGLLTEPHSTTEGLHSATGDLRSAECHGQETMTQQRADGTRSVPAPLELSPLIARVVLPETWRFLLLIPKTATGLFGPAEREAFAHIPPVPLEVTETLSRELLLSLVPAALEANFTEFSRSLHRYGRIAGECFASQQHGAFLNRRTAELVEAIRALGGEGVGQSSWGPTLFVAVKDEAFGHELAARLGARHDLSDYDAIVTRPNNAGAQIEFDRID